MIYIYIKLFYFFFTKMVSSPLKRPSHSYYKPSLCHCKVLVSMSLKNVLVVTCIGFTVTEMYFTEH